MDDDRSVLKSLVQEAYPNLAILDSLEDWLAGRFTSPIAFIQLQGVMEKGNTLTTCKIITDARIVLQYPKVDEVYQPISTEPLRNVLRSNQYSYRGNSDGQWITINSETLEVSLERKDRTEITFQYETIKKIVQQETERILSFEIEEDWV